MSNLMQRLLPVLVNNSVRLRHTRIYRALQQTLAGHFPVFSGRCLGSNVDAECVFTKWLFCSHLSS